MDEWDVWNDSPQLELDIRVPISAEFVRMLELHDDELVPCFKAIGPLCGIRQPVIPVKSAGRLLVKRDHDVVDELVKELDPELLELARILFIPDSAGDIYDLTIPENQTRLGFLKSFEIDSIVTRNYSAEMCLDFPRLMMGNRIAVDSYDIVDHLDFVSSNYPKSLWSVYVQAVGQLSGIGRRVSDLKEMLQIFRAGRRLSKSLNKFSKVNQLQSVDYDNPFFWFNFDGDFLEPEEIVLVGVMPPQVRMRYPCSVYDPGLEGTYREKVVLANLVTGDESGIYGVDRALLAKIYVNCLDCEYYCHTVPVDFNPPLSVIRKPRPHNMTAIVKLGSSSYNAGSRFYKKVFDSNVSRNKRYIEDTSFVPLLKQYAGVDYVFERAGKPRGGFVKPREKNRKVKKTRSYEKRDAMLKILSADEGFKFDSNRTMSISGDCAPGPLLQDIPHWGDARLVLNSLYKRAVDSGFRVMFLNGIWRVEE